MKKIIVTTSWDDGAKEDLKILEYLNKHNLRGTFYIPKKIELEVEKFEHLKLLSEQEIVDIARTQEIGAHTLTHVYLNKAQRSVEEEIIGSKQWLESLIQESIQVFAFPGGVCTSESIKIIKQSGFIGARTTKLFQINITDSFLMGVSVCLGPIFSMPKNWSLRYKFKVLIYRAFRVLRGVIKLKLPINSIFGWKRLVKNVFGCVLKNGGVFHLYGHSWEIEKHNLWNKVEEIFGHIANRENIKYLTNSEAIKNNENSFIK